MSEKNNFEILNSINDPSDVKALDEKQLTKLCEENYRRGVMLEGSIGGMLKSIFTSPISVVLCALLVFLFVTQTETYKNWKAKREAAAK